MRVSMSDILWLDGATPWTCSFCSICKLEWGTWYMVSPLRVCAYIYVYLGLDGSLHDCMIVSGLTKTSGDFENHTWAAFGTRGDWSFQFNDGRDKRDHFIGLILGPHCFSGAVRTSKGLLPQLYVMHHNATFCAITKAFPTAYQKASNTARWCNLSLWHPCMFPFVLLHNALLFGLAPNTFVYSLRNFVGCQSCLVCSTMMQCSCWVCRTLETWNSFDIW